MRRMALSLIGSVAAAVNALDPFIESMEVSGVKSKRSGFRSGIKKRTIGKKSRSQKIRSNRRKGKKDVK